MNLPRELDFTLEARNADECRKMLQVGGSRYDDVYIPKVYPKLSSHRILTMEFIEGVKVRLYRQVETCTIRVKIQLSVT